MILLRHTRRVRSSRAGGPAASIARAQRPGSTQPAFPFDSDTCNAALVDRVRKRIRAFFCSGSSELNSNSDAHSFRIYGNDRPHRGSFRRPRGGIGPPFLGLSSPTSTAVVRGEPSSWATPAANVVSGGARCAQSAFRLDQGRRCLSGTRRSCRVSAAMAIAAIAVAAHMPTR